MSKKDSEAMAASLLTFLLTVDEDLAIEELSVSLSKPRRCGLVKMCIYVSKMP